MQIKATIRRMTNTITPDLQKKLKRVSGSMQGSILAEIGMALVSMAKRSFATDPGFRPSPWKNKRDGSPSTLTKSTELRKSIQANVTAGRVRISSNKRYAAIHQLGGITRPHIIRARHKKALAFGGRFAKSVKHPGSRIPARPYLPFYADGSLTVKAAKRVESLIIIALKKE